MNKKFISALLFGAMLFAPASMFVSCSYDDDIAELRNDLNATKTDLSSLVDEKMKNVDAEIAALGAQAEALEAAYEAADEALQEAIANATNDAKGYADVQVAQAQAAAIAAAQEMVNGAKAALEASLAEVNAIVGEQGKTIAALLEADQTLTTAIAAAQARANEAYALAEQASKLATENAESVQKLTEALGALQATVKTLEAQAQTCVLGDKVEDLIKKTADNAAAIEAQAAKLKALEESNAAALESAVNAAKAELQTLISANTAEINKLKTAVEAAKAETAKAVEDAKKVAADALAAAKTELKDLISANTAALKDVEEAYKTADKALDEKINTLLNDLEDLEGEVEEINAELKKINDNLAYAGKKLKSMVFCPELYYQGIEAVGVYSYNYKAITLAAADVTAVQNEDKPTVTTEQISVVPDVTFNYFLNPSNAQVSNKVENFNFILNNAKYTRAIAKDQISIVKVSDEDGKLSVVAKMHNANAISEISNTANESNVDVVALQYTDKNQNDTIITSDFAALKHYVVDEFYINKVNTYGAVDAVLANSGENHLKATAAAAINADPMFEIAYMDDAIELDKWINVHYSYNGSADQVWGGQTTVNGKNFKLVYELIGYKAGSNTTSESEHATISNNVLTTKGYNNEITPAIVGRTPLLRVKLVDENSNKIAAVGYAKILITHIKVDDMFVGPYGVDKPFVVACNPSTVDLGKMMSWDKIENDVLAEIGLSRQQFDDLYKLDVDASNVAYQFTLTNGSYVSTQNWGSVKETDDNEAAHETDVLTWTVDNNTAYQFFKNENNKTKSVIVRFVPTNAADNGIRPVIYVTLSWTPSSRLVAPYASISDESKVYGTWYAKNANSLGKSDLHAHVMEAKQGTTDDFDFSVEKSTFMDENGQIVKPSALINKSLDANGYTALANSADFKVIYNFVASEYMKAGSAKTGKKDYYTLRVWNNATELQASVDQVTWTRIAVLDVNTGKIKYENNTVSCDILNYVSHNKLAEGETLTAKVKMVASTCQPASAIALSNHEMYVKFLRPLNVEGTKLAVVDADPSTHTIKLVKGAVDALGNKAELNFTDWRDFNNEQVWTSSNNTVNLFKFYGVRSIEQNTDKDVTSNFAMGGDNFTKLNSSEFVFTYACTGQPSSSNMGTVTYKKVTTVAVHEFTAKIPVIVTYDWGKLYAEIEVLVKPTINNARVNK